jgi:DegV family protein with EDD domain
VDITTSQFFRRLARTDTMPFSSPPTLSDFHEVYANLAEETDQIISIHVSTKLSETTRVAVQAMQPFLGRCRIVPFDSQLVSVGQGFLVATAARIAQEGATMDEIIRLLRGVIPHIYIVFFARELQYLERGGYLSQAQTILGSMLGVRPLLIVEDGEIQPLEKVRSRTHALERLVEFIAEFSQIETATLLYSSSPEEAREATERLRFAFPEMEISSSTYGMVLATHIGPGAVGAMVYEGME